MKLPITLFASSFTLVVAAGLVQLDAGPEADGPAARPVLHDLTVGDHQLELSLDRGRVPAGEQVKLAIVGRQGGAGDRLRVAVLQQGGSPMSRSMPPPTEVFHRDVVVSRDGTLNIPLTLKGKNLGRPSKGPAADPLAIAGQVTQFTVVVTPLDAKDDASAAYLPVFAYEPEAYRMEIEPLAAAEPGQEIEVAIKVTSLVDKPLRGITVGASADLASIEDGGQIATLAPHATTIVRLRATRVAPSTEPGQPAKIQAYGYAEYGGTAAAWASFDADKGTLIARASESELTPFMLGL